VRSVECLFCKIVNGEIPATIVHDGAQSVAFRDLNPAAPTHVLVVPKRHIDHAGTVSGADAETLADMFLTAQAVAAKDGIASTGYRLVFNVGVDSGNTVNHLHLHVVGGRPMGWPPFAS
jgi:histidine triad (HIT) family protein